jgi:hypothetical protein
MDRCGVVIMEWYYRNEEVEKLPEDTFGFIYKLHYRDGFYYIGKKQCFNTITLPVLNTGKKRIGHIKIIGRNVNNKRKYFEVVHRENDWRDYEGSSDELSKYVLIKKEVLRFCKSKRELTYQEVRYQFLHDVLNDDMALNKNILNKFFKGNLE